MLFFVCSLAGALFNVASLAFGESLAAWLILRFATGFFLAGIYPVGMKIAAGWYERDLGKALGFLVGALVLGTAFPHLLKELGQSLPWQAVTLGASATAVAGGLVEVAFVPDRPYLQQAAKIHTHPLSLIFQRPPLLASNVGHF